MNQKTLLYVFEWDNPAQGDNWTRHSWLHFLRQHLDCALILVRYATDLRPELFEGAYVIGVICHQQRYDDSHHAQVIEFARDNFRADLPILVIPDGSPDHENWFERIHDDHVQEYYPRFDKPPQWLRDIISSEVVIDPPSLHFELDPRRFAHIEPALYWATHLRAENMRPEQIKKACSESSIDVRVGRGDHVSAFMLETQTLLVLSTNERAAHESLDEIMELLLERHVEISREFDLEPILGTIVRGWIYHWTGEIGLPVLEIAASLMDWDNPETGPMLRRVVAWAHAQCQVLPYLSDGFVPPLTAE